MSENYVFDWGSCVRVIEAAPSPLHPGCLGSVCGMRNGPEGNLYLIEFSSGEAVEILEKWLEVFI